MTSYGSQGRGWLFRGGLWIVSCCAILPLLAQQPQPQQERPQQEQVRERWNRVFTADQPRFNTHPNDFLKRMTAGREPGTALDLGMGQGRNAIYLAEQGWLVTGVDIADEGLRIASETARQKGVPLETVLESAYEFDFGQDRWDLVAIIYFGARGLVSKIKQGLKPGGLVIVEGFHQEATEDRRIGRGVVWESNELLDLFRQEGFRIIRYEDEMGLGDYGQERIRLVRLAAEKPR